MMLIIPAIDLKKGRCVRLQQGQFDRVSVYEQSAYELAKYYVEQGARNLHVVDLDGAQTGNLQQLALIQSLPALPLNIQVGGGLRTIESLKACRKAGISRFVLGSVAVSQPELCLQMIAEAGAKSIVLALDINMDNNIPRTASHGWQKASDKTLWDLVAFWQNAGVTQVLCTDIACDGMLQGPNVRLYAEAVRRFPQIAWQASGGIRHREDIRTLAETGVAAVILGRVLYEGKLDLAALIREEESLC